MKKNINGNNVHKEEINLIENVDYFNMADGLYLTIDSISKKYNIAKNTVYKRASANNIQSKKIAGVTCYLDVKAFERQERVHNTAGLKPAISYTELVNIVKDMNQLLLASNTRTFTHTGEIEAIRDKVNLIYEAMARIEKFIHEINSLAKGENK